MTSLMKERIFVLILKSTFDALSVTNQNKLINRSVTFNKSNLVIITKISDSLQYYILETNRRLAPDCDLNQYSWYLKSELLALF